MKILKNQQGFGAVETILVLIIVILIGVAGWLVYDNHHKQPPPPAKTSTSKATTTTNAAPPQPANIAATDVTQLVTDFYTKYKTCNGDYTCETNLVKQYGTTNLYAYFKPATGTYTADPIMCAQMLPDSIGAVSGVTTTSTSASGTITTNYTGASGGKIKFTVTKTTGNLNIDTITCSPPLHASTTGP